jgi:hypothetical protein
MNTSQNTVDRPVTSGSGWAVWSWVMLPLVLVSFIATFVLSSVLLGMFDLEGSEPMSEQGLIGWVVVLLGLLIAPLPNYLGLWFGVRGSRLGEGAWAIVAAALNGVVVAGLWLLIGITTLNQL